MDDGSLWNAIFLAALSTLSALSPLRGVRRR
jgi:hypothetical protein